jgi:hypothetical protein
VSVVAQKSDQTEYFANYYGGSGPGSRPKYQIRTDDTGQADSLAALMFAHLNRRFPAVKVTLPLNVAVDLGDHVTLTHRHPAAGHRLVGQALLLHRDQLPAGHPEADLAHQPDA